MLGLERLELVHQGVELGVGDLRRRLNVIELFVVADLPSEGFDAISGGHGRRPWVSAIALQDVIGERGQGLALRARREEPQLPLGGFAELDGSGGGGGGGSGRE